MAQSSDKPNDNQPGGQKLNWAAALKSVQGRKALLIELTQIFLEEYPRILQRIDEAIAADNAKDLQIHSHALKGSLRYFGETTAWTTAFEMERLSRDGNLKAAMLRRPKLAVELESLLPELRRFAGSSG